MAAEAPDTGTAVPKWSAGVDQMDAVRDLYDREAMNDNGQSTRGFMRWLERRDIAALFRLLTPARRETALVAGCGLGLHAHLLKQAGLQVWATDLSPGAVENVTPFVDEARIADLMTLDLGVQFDRIVCFGVLDFVPDPERCVHNLAGHLRPGGRLVVEVPQRSWSGRIYRWGYRRTRGLQINLFDWRELVEMGTSNGLDFVGRDQTFFHNILVGWNRRPLLEAASPTISATGA